MEAIKTLTLKIPTIAVLEILIHIAEAGVARSIEASLRLASRGILKPLAILGSLLRRSLIASSVRTRGALRSVL